MLFFKHFHAAIPLQTTFFVMVLVPLCQIWAHQDQSGYISIDCGLTDVPSYTDATTGFNYVSDTGFTDFGENMAISPGYKISSVDQQFWNLRSFPQGTRNCYTLRPFQGKGTRYLIRARFMYGNYDNNNQLPTFQLFIGVDLWDTVKFDATDSEVNKVIMYLATSDHIQVCLVNTEYGVPFVSVIELRTLVSGIYTSENGTALRLEEHYDFSSGTTQIRRYPDDAYDRLWKPLSADTWRPFLNATFSHENLEDQYEIPSAVMGTAYTRNPGTNYIGFSDTKANSSSTFVWYMYFSELAILLANQSREFNIYVQGNFYGILSPKYLKQDTIISQGVRADETGTTTIWLNNTNTANMPPLINAAEVYEIVELSGQDTNQTDVEAIYDVKAAYGLKRLKWQGDPCGPQAYLWDGLNCSYAVNSSSRIIYLNLSSSGLKGEIASSVANLAMLQYLDLSNNNLTGKVPEFLAYLSFLKVLNLKGNNFVKPIPDALLSKKGLELSLDENLVTSCSSGSCGKKKKFVVPLVASLGGVLFVGLIIVVVIWKHKRRRHKNIAEARAKTTNVEHKEESGSSFLSKKQQFQFSDIQRITNNFEIVLGEGGFGKVYHGFLNGHEVAVKMLSSQSIQGQRQFHAELKLLLRVHHKNLTTLVGYCNEGTNFGLIYEYMAMGNLRSHISGRRRTVLSWEDRLRIALDIAQGLEYLHNGCKPPIVHRDVKSTNILLNEKFQAKLGDFGLSKIFPLEGGNHVSGTETPGISTSIAGTAGYLDPEYYTTNWLNEKSDVYSFGVVLLEIITGRPVLTKTRENNYIVEWVSSMLARGDIKSILDPKLEEDCDINTVWKTIEIAMACVSKQSSNRPIMSKVITELKECLGSEMIHRNGRDVADLSKESSVEMISKSMISEYSPVAR